MRDKIVDKVVTELNKNLNTPINVGSIDLTFWASFPNLSVDFNEIFIKDAVENAKETDTLFYSTRVRLKFNPMDIIQKNYKVKKIDVFPGYAHIKNFADGKTNYDITKPSDQAASAAVEFSLKEVSFSDFRLDYSNFSAKQFHSTRLKELALSGDFTEEIIDLNAESNLDILFAQSGDVKLVQNKSAYFDLNLRINQTDGSIIIPEAPITISNLPFTAALLVQPNLIDFRLKAKDIDLVQLAQNIQHDGTTTIKNLQGSGKVEFDLHYNDKRKENEQAEIECTFGVANGNIVEPSKNLRISNIQISGYYGNIDKKKGEHLELEQFNFNTPAGPFSGNLLLTKFSQPRYQGKAKGRIDLGVLHALFPIPSVQSTSGKVDVDSRFDLQKTELGMDINTCEGDLTMQNVHCQLKDDKRYFDHISGRVYLENTVAGIDKVSLTVGKSDLRLNGKIEHIENYLNKKGNLYANIDLSSAFLDVQDFSTTEKAEEIKNGRNYILPNDIEGDFHLLANNLQYENHQFKQLNTRLLVKGRNLHFADLSLQNAGANIAGQVYIAENSPEIFTINTNVASDNISFQPMFKEWNDFHQTTISSENIQGIAHARLQFSAPFDLRSGIVSKDILADIQIRIEDGRLKNVEAFKSITASLNDSKVTKMILRENNISDFEKNLLDLKFASLQNTITIKNGIMTIPKMTISSNAITLNLAGTHSFDNEVDYHFDFNLRDIKKVKTQSEFGEIIEDGTGLRLFAHMFGNLENPTIKWDREQKKLLAKESIEQEKITTKQMLKAELGLFKNDSSVVSYKPKTQAKEEIQMQFGKKEEEQSNFEDKPAKNTKVNRTLQKWKDEAKKEKEGEVIWNRN